MKLLAVGGVILLAYMVLIVQFYRASKKGCNSTADAVMQGGSLRILNQRHLISLVAMAAAVLVVGFVKSDWLLTAMPGTNALLLTLAVGATAGAISIMTARKARPSLAFRNRAASSGMYLFLRALFLIVYELFLRAVLLSFCIAVTNVPVAIIINIILYAIAHAFSTRQELIGTIPFGILLCGLTLFSGSVWPAVGIHLLLGLPYDILILSKPKQNRKIVSA